MVRRFLKEWSFQKRSLGLYLAFSTCAATVILVGLIFDPSVNSSLRLLDWSLLDWSHRAMHEPIATSFVAINASVLIKLWPHLGIINPGAQLIAFFLTQFALLLGMAVHHERLEFIYLSTMPIVAVLFAIQSDWHKPPRFKLRMAGLTLALCCFSYLSVLAHPSFKSQVSVGVFLLGAFCLWQFGTIYLANVEWMRSSRATVMQLIKNKQEKSEHFLSPAESERYFFHDVINHTHGMGLLLRYRLMKNRGLSYEESLAFAGELEALQVLVKEHFGYDHKNLCVNAFEEKRTSWKSFSELKNLTYNLVQSYFPDSKVEAYFLFKGTLREELENDPLLPFVAYHRIVTNIIKNCSEADSRRLEIIFEGTEKELVLIVKNDVYKNHSYGYELGKTLENIISSGTSEKLGGGVGLESIENLSQIVGGSFHFFIEDGHWVSQVHLPFKNPLKEENAKSLKVHSKKAA